MSDRDVSMYRQRQQLEQQELEALAPYALASGDSRGRLHPEAEPRYRTAFQRDRDRIVHCAAFRLLEYKTQVFVNDAGDYFRTRLTHTLEVAQIGRTMARALGANEDLVEAICLAHDLGHPPFGHAGEDILNQLMADCGGFNHNHQSYRVVTKLERRYPNWNGLNLTLETLEGVAKHETDYDVSALVGIAEETGPGLEAQIANIADELAYNAHDLDDGLHAGLFSVNELDVLEIWRRVVNHASWQGGRLDEVARHNLIRELVGLLVDDVLQQSAANIESVKPGSSLNVQHHSQPLVAHSSDQKAHNTALKEFLFQNMYRHCRIVRMQARAEHVLQALYDRYIREPLQLPDEYRAKLDCEIRERVVADYLASLTDRSALNQYRQFFEPLTQS